MLSVPFRNRTETKGDVSRPSDAPRETQDIERDLHTLSDRIFRLGCYFVKEVGKFGVVRSLGTHAVACGKDC